MSISRAGTYNVQCPYGKNLREKRDINGKNDRGGEKEEERGEEREGLANVEVPQTRNYVFLSAPRTKFVDRSGGPSVSWPEIKTRGTARAEAEEGGEGSSRR